MRPQDYARMARMTGRLALVPALLIAAALPAQADWRQLAPQNLAALGPHSYLPGANGSLWSLSDDGVRLTLADGTTRVVLRHEEAPYFEGELLADGSIVLRSQCRLQRLDAQGRRSWSLPGTPLEECNDLAMLADGRFWLSRDERLLAYDAHGKQQVSVEAGDSGLHFNSLVALSNGDVVPHAIAAMWLR